MAFWSRKKNNEESGDRRKVRINRTGNPVPRPWLVQIYGMIGCLVITLGFIGFVIFLQKTLPDGSKSTFHPTWRRDLKIDSGNSIRARANSSSTPAATFIFSPIETVISTTSNAPLVFTFDPIVAPFSLFDFGCSTTQTACTTVEVPARLGKRYQETYCSTTIQPVACPTTASPTPTPTSSVDPCVTTEVACHVGLSGRKRQINGCVTNYITAASCLSSTTSSSSYTIPTSTAVASSSIFSSFSPPTSTAAISSSIFSSSSPPTSTAAISSSILSSSSPSVVTAAASSSIFSSSSPAVSSSTVSVGISVTETVSTSSVTAAASSTANFDPCVSNFESCTTFYSVEAESTVTSCDFSSITILGCGTSTAPPSITPSSLPSTTRSNLLIPITSPTPTPSPSPNTCMNTNIACYTDFPTPALGAAIAEIGGFATVTNTPAPIINCFTTIASIECWMTITSNSSSSITMTPKISVSPPNVSITFSNPPIFTSSSSFATSTTSTTFSSLAVISSSSNSMGSSSISPPSSTFPLSGPILSSSASSFPSFSSTLSLTPIIPIGGIFSNVYSSTSDSLGTSASAPSGRTSLGLSSSSLITRTSSNSSPVSSNLSPVGSSRPISHTLSDSSTTPLSATTSQSVLVLQSISGSLLLGVSSIPPQSPTGSPNPTSPSSVSFSASRVIPASGTANSISVLASPPLDKIVQSVSINSQSPFASSGSMSYAFPIPSPHSVTSIPSVTQLSSVSLLATPTKLFVTSASTHHSNSMTDFASSVSLSTVTAQRAIATSTPGSSSSASPSATSLGGGGGSPNSTDNSAPSDLNIYPVSRVVVGNYVPIIIGRSFIGLITPFYTSILQYEPIRELTSPGGAFFCSLAGSPAILIPVSMAMLIANLGSGFAAGATFLDTSYCVSPPCAPRLSSNPWILDIILTTLVIQAIAILVMAQQWWKKPSSISADPTSIAGVAVVMGHPAIERQFSEFPADITAAELKTQLKGSKYQLGEFTTERGFVKFGIMPKERDRLKPQKEPGFWSKIGAFFGAIKENIPFIDDWRNSRLYFDAAFLMFLLALLVITCLTLSKVKQSPQVVFLATETASGTGMRIFFAILGVIVSTYWGILFRDIQTFTPYISLGRGSADPSNTILLRQHTFPLTAFLPLLFQSHYTASSVAFTALISEILIIALAGLPYRPGQHRGEYLFWASLSLLILLLMIVQLIVITQWRKKLPVLPRAPDSIAAVMALVARTGMSRDFEGLSRCGTKERDRGVRELGKVYAYGWRREVGDGRVRWVIDEVGVKEERVSRRESGDLERDDLMPRNTGRRERGDSF